MFLIHMWYSGIQMMEAHWPCFNRLPVAPSRVDLCHEVRLAVSPLPQTELGQLNRWQRGLALCYFRLYMLATIKVIAELVRTWDSVQSYWIYIATRTMTWDPPCILPWHWNNQSLPYLINEVTRWVAISINCVPLVWPDMNCLHFVHITSHVRS